MSNKIFKWHLFVFIFFLIPAFVFADEVVLKSGQKIEGKIIEQTDKYVKIDSGIGMGITYYMDEINSVNGQNSGAGESAGIFEATSGAPSNNNLSNAHISADKPENVFANKVIAALGQNKEAFFALYSSQPSDNKRQENEQTFGLLQMEISSGAKIKSVDLMPAADAEKYKSICPEPYNVDIGVVQKSFSNGGTESMSMDSKLPIGQVNGEWKILYTGSE